MRRFFRLVFKLGLLAAIGVGVALAVKKLTAPPPLPDELEPWPPISPDPVTEPSTAVDEPTPESANGSASESEESTASSN